MQKQLKPGTLLKWESADGRKRHLYMIVSIDALDSLFRLRVLYNNESGDLEEWQCPRSRLLNYIRHGYMLVLT